MADIQSSLNGLFGSMLSPGHAAEARQFLAELQMRAGTDSEFERDPQSPTQNEPALEDRLMKLCAEIAQLPAEKQEELRLAARDGAERLRSGWTTPIELQFPLVRDVSVRSEPGTLGEIENLSLAVAPGGLLTLQRGTQVAAQGNMLALLDPTALVVDNGEFRFSQDARPNSPTGFSGVSFRCTFPAGSTFAIAA